MCVQAGQRERSDSGLYPYSSCLQNKNWYFRRPSPTGLLFIISFYSLKIKMGFSRKSDMFPNAGLAGCSHTGASTI